MAEGNTIELEGVLEQFVNKLEPCIGRGDLDACVEVTARLAGEIGCFFKFRRYEKGYMYVRGNYRRM